MFKLGKALTNVRPEKNEGTVVIATPTPGNIRISTKLAVALEITDCSRISLLMLENEGESFPAIFVSPYGHKKENGELVVDDEGKTQYFATGEMSENGTLNTKGQKLAYANGVSGALQFSSRTSWDALEGQKNGSQKWEIPGLGEDEDAAAWVLEEDGRTIYALRAGDFEEKTERVAHTEEAAEEAAEEA